ncbi:MFS transporter [Streptomyces koyangensis]|uniref:MFS transporter n=1 Tax=Streptomyces koyangensis TaxID=188770 RepID=A0A385DKN9_9ACTN|nr:MFS transporter [Streptomyces koyangensis]AXQ58509.1 MFS transporter [Streptomyces koyangensis]WTD01296.1 MFS transporter [Streptomyces albidoflavus]
MTERTERASVLASLRHRSFRNLVFGRTLTHWANSMAPIALAFAVLDMTGSAVDVGIVVGSRSVANVLLVLFGGVLADWVPRALILQGSSLSAATVQAAVAVVLLTDSASLGVLILLSVVNGAVAAVSMPASASLVPQTVPAGELRAANALSRMGVNTGMIVGASFGGMITSVFGPGWGMAANAVVFAAAALAYHGVRVPRTKRAPGAPSQPLRELREGWTEFTARTWVWVVVLQFFVVNAVAAGGIQVLGPTIANSTYGRTAWGLVLATQMAGALIGGFLVGRSRSRHALRIGVAVVALDALPLIALAETAPLALLVLAMFVNGLALEQFGVAWDVSLQENVPPDRLARVYSYDMLGSILALPVGEMSAGVLAERFGSRATLLGGVCLVVSVTVAALCSKDVRSLTVRAGHADAEAPGATAAGAASGTAAPTEPTRDPAG